MLPITIGVFGDWGSGKSSLMLLMQESIEKWKVEMDERNQLRIAGEWTETKDVFNRRK
jgi:ATPase subunit of ABC transporter with duplicated ATPase domains